MRKGNSIPKSYGGDKLGLLDVSQPPGQQADPNNGRQSAASALAKGQEETKERSKAKVGTGGTILGEKNVAQMETVKTILANFKSNTKDGLDVKKQYQLLKELEDDDEDSIVAALEQLSDILCQAAFFQKAYDILKLALNDYPDNPVLNELMARICFIMEHFGDSIFYNKKAKKLQSEDMLKVSDNHSDIGLAYYRLALQSGDDTKLDLAFKSFRKALELNPDNTNATVNMGLVYKHREHAEMRANKGESEAAKLFNTAVKKDKFNFKDKDIGKRNGAALVNLGVIEYEFAHYEDACILFLDALQIKPDDQEALCNLGLALKHTAYSSYAQLAFEEAVHVAPGNTFILSNYMMLLLEQQNFGMFKKVQPHAKRIMEDKEYFEITKLFEEFQIAVLGSKDDSIPDHNSHDDSVRGKSINDPDLQSSLKRGLQKTGLNAIEEASDQEDDV